MECQSREFPTRTCILIMAHQQVGTGRHGAVSTNGGHPRYLPEPSPRTGTYLLLAESDLGTVVFSTLRNDGAEETRTGGWCICYAISVREEHISEEGEAISPPPLTVSFSIPSALRSRNALAGPLELATACYPNVDASARACRYGCTHRRSSDEACIAALTKLHLAGAHGRNRPYRALISSSIRSATCTASGGGSCHSRPDERPPFSTLFYFCELSLRGHRRYHLRFDRQMPWNDSTKTLARRIKSRSTLPVQTTSHGPSV